MRCDHSAGKTGKIRQRLLQKHRLKFPRRAGQVDDDLPILLYRAAGRGAVIIAKHNTALRQIRLFAVRLRHLLPAGLEKGLYAPHALRILHQRQAKRFRAHLFGQVVHRGAKPSGGQHKIAAGERRLQQVGKPLFIIAHRAVVKHGEPKPRQLPGKELRVCIDDVAEQKLCSDG